MFSFCIDSVDIFFSEPVFVRILGLPINSERFSFGKNIFMFC